MCLGRWKKNSPWGPPLLRGGHTIETVADFVVQEFIQDVIAAAGRDRMPELFAHPHPDALYYIPHRSGLSVIALPTPALSPAQLTKLLRYRLAQYLAVGFLDDQRVYEARLEHEPAANVLPADIHYVAGNALTGEIICYLTLRGLAETPYGTTLRTPNRPLFPIEEIYGWGTFNRLQVLPDLDISRIREIGRLAKNQQLPAFDDLGKRAPREIWLALFRTLTGPLRMEIDAFIGDFDENVAKKNLDYFHIPTTTIRGVLPYTPEDDYNVRHLQVSERYPFAVLISDLVVAMRSRWPNIEQALEQPGKQGLRALFALKEDIASLRSSLEPAGDSARLSQVRIPQRGVPMIVRRQMLDRGEQLRCFDLFRGLSVAEATVLGFFMERIEVSTGTVIIYQGALGDSLYLVEAGQAEARIRILGESFPVRRFGPGEYFGEIGLLTGRERTADVVALSPLCLWRLIRATYIRYLSRVVEVERHITYTAILRLAERLRHTP